MRRALTVVALLSLAACAPTQSPEEAPSDSTTTGPAPGVAAPEGWEPVTTGPEDPTIPATQPAAQEGASSGAASSWGTEVDPVDRASATLAVGCATPPSLEPMTPTKAVEGLLDRDGAPGVVMQFTFDDDAQATAFQDAWIDQMRACGAEIVEEMVAEPGYWAGHRRIEENVWTESSVKQGEHVSFIAVQGDLDEQATRKLSEAQREG